MADNPVVWFEIYVDDMARAQRFYETVLGVSLSPLPMPEGDGSGLQMLAFPAGMEQPGAAGALVRMPGVAPLDRCIRVSCGPEADMAALAAALPGALARAQLSELVTQLKNLDMAKVHAEMAAAQNNEPDPE